MKVSIYCSLYVWLCVTTGLHLLIQGTDAKKNQGKVKIKNAKKKQEKVTICHVPPGDPTKLQTIKVAQAAVKAHLAHGDTLGDCGAGSASAGVAVFDSSFASVSDASVSLTFVNSGYTATEATDANGLASFKNLPVDGAFVVDVKAGDLIGSGSGSVSSGTLQSTTIIIVGQVGSASLSGTVKDTNGIPVANALVNYIFTETEQSGSALTDEAGFFEFAVDADRVVILTAFAPSGEFASGSTSVPSAVSAIIYDLVLAPLGEILPEATNLNFANGLDGWTVIGLIQSFLVEELFDPQVTTSGLRRHLQGPGCAVLESKVISTAGSSNNVGSLTETFTVPLGYESLQGRVKFYSNEYPEYVGSVYNDNFAVLLTTPTGVKILAKDSLNSANWSPSNTLPSTDANGDGSGFYEGETGDYNFVADLSGLAGQPVTLTFEVRDVTDLIFDSALAIADLRVYRTGDFFPVPNLGGPATATTTISAQLGQGVRITVKNLNVLGTTVYVEDQSFPSSPTRKQLIILPLSESTFEFGIFGAEPMFRKFEIGTVVSDAFTINVSVESTWTEGLPPNPCISPIIP